MAASTSEKPVDLAALVLKIGELIAHVEFWVSDGRLQSFEDRQRFRKASRELLDRHSKGAP